MFEGGDFGQQVDGTQEIKQERKIRRKIFQILENFQYKEVLVTGMRPHAQSTSHWWPHVNLENQAKNKH